MTSKPWTDADVIAFLRRVAEGASKRELKHETGRTEKAIGVKLEAVLGTRDLRGGKARHLARRELARRRQSDGLA